MNYTKGVYMYILVNYKTNTRLKKTYSTFMKAFNVLENLENSDIKIEY